MYGYLRVVTAHFLLVVHFVARHIPVTYVHNVLKAEPRFPMYNFKYSPAPVEQ